MSSAFEMPGKESERIEQKCQDEINRAIRVKAREQEWVRGGEEAAAEAVAGD
ncbi:MAG: hypothetical protein V1792_13335 [Pseudomonadota bacterium]